MLAMRILEIEFSRIFNTKPQPVRQMAKVQENSNFPNFLEQTLDYNSDIVHFLITLFWNYRTFYGKFKIVWTKNEQYQISNLFFALVATKLPKSISFDNDLIYTLLYLTTASSYYL